jgi:NTE family protein
VANQADKDINKWLPFFSVLLLVMLLSFSYFTYRGLNSWLFHTRNGLSENEVKNYDFVLGTLGIAAVCLLLLMIVFSIFRTNLGFNRGVRVYEWMQAVLATPYVGIVTTSDLIDRKKAETKPQQLKANNECEAFTTDPRLVFIAANLTHNRIVKFPDNAGDYWHQDYKDYVSPAVYVRASMSLPFIFYPMIPSDAHIIMPDKKPVDTVQLLARFIDGGMLSNFPIREFHVPAGMQPRYPTFGVLLGGPPPDVVRDNEETKKKFFKVSVFRFILSFISTFRSFYDKDFLRNHKEFQLLVKAVDTKEFNSLDFSMDIDTKKKLFAAGARTAVDQLVSFNWEHYLKVRLENT